MITVLEKANVFLWGVPVLLLILGTGFVLSLSTGFLQISKLPQALKCLGDRSHSDSGVSPYRALCTALGATVGTGNLAGVAGAICIGGPGSVFWMCVSGMIGMLVKFAEIVLAMRYRQRNVAGDWTGGPMYTIQNAMPRKFLWLAYIYSFFGVVAVFGVGNTVQVSTIFGSLETIFQTRISLLSNVLLGGLLSTFIYCAFSGGHRSIGRICEGLVPFSAGLYVFLCIVVLILRINRIPGAVSSIILGAFSPRAVTGGAIHSAFTALRTGVARGVFTNEAGMGTASIAHAESACIDPVKQGLLGITEVFVDTILICTLTALVILCSGVSIDYRKESDITLTLTAFSNVLGNWSSILVGVISCFLAIATIFGWGLYGARCMEFLFGTLNWKYFALLQAIAVVIGATMNTGVVWLLSEFINGLMAIPNMISILYLFPIFLKTVKAYRW